MPTRRQPRRAALCGYRKASNEDTRLALLSLELWLAGSGVWLRLMWPSALRIVLVGRDQSLGSLQRMRRGCSWHCCSVQTRTHTARHIFALSSQVRDTSHVRNMHTTSVTLACSYKHDHVKCRLCSAATNSARLGGVTNMFSLGSRSCFTCRRSTYRLLCPACDAVGTVTSAAAAAWP